MRALDASLAHIAVIDVKRTRASPAGAAAIVGELETDRRSTGLERFVRRDAVISLPEAVRKLTSFPASQLRIDDRGFLQVGMRADLLVFDPSAVRERATFPQPLTLSEGFDVARALRKAPETKDVRIVMLTAVDEVYSLRMEVEQAWVPCDRWLEKPIEPEDLLRHVAEVLAADPAPGGPESS